jgi:hypothetical protein
MVPSPLVFQMISTHFTAPPFVPHVPTFLNLFSFPTEIQVEPGDLNRNLKRRLQNSLRPVIPDNACTPRLTAAAGTWLAGAYSHGTVILLVPCKRSLQPEGLHPSRGVARSGFPPLPKIPGCCHP